MGADRHTYIELQNRVTAAVNAADPIGLLALGCPSDEYGPEISRILPLLSRATSLQQFEEQLYGLFVEMFNETAGAAEGYRELASELWSFR
jgi:hypothetical protein